MSDVPTEADFGRLLYTFGIVADVQGGDKPTQKIKLYRYVLSMDHLPSRY